MSEALPKVRALSIGDHPRPHLLGWGEDGPPVGGRTERCPICHALPGRPHSVVVMGVEETALRLESGDPVARLAAVEQALLGFVEAYERNEMRPEAWWSMAEDARALLEGSEQR